MTVSTLEIGLEEARFKAAGVVATGLRTLEFYAAAFGGPPDKNGDIIEPHAFDGWLKAFYAAGKALPISFNHAAVLDGLDPTNVVGYAPADPQHVWVDDYGLRVKGFLDTASEKGKAVEWQIENGLLKGASLAFEVPEGGMVEKADHNLITAISVVRETGPVPNPANQTAVLLWLKSEGMLAETADVPYMTVAEFRDLMEVKEAPETPESDLIALKLPDGATTMVAVVADDEVEVAHQKAAASLQHAHDALVRAGAVCASVGEVAKSEDTELGTEPQVVEPDPPRSVEEFVQEVRRQTAETIAGDAVAVRNRKMKLLESSLP